MIEVFRTNVEHPHQVNMLIDKIQQNFTGYIANFDLEDCDRILRVKCSNGVITSYRIISLMNDYGFNAEVLPDELLPYQTMHVANGMLIIN